MVVIDGIAVNTKLTYVGMSSVQFQKKDSHKRYVYVWQIKLNTKWYISCVTTHIISETSKFQY